MFRRWFGVMEILPTMLWILAVSTAFFVGLAVYVEVWGFSP